MGDGNGLQQIIELRAELCLALDNGVILRDENIHAARHRAARDAKRDDVK